MNSRGKAEQNDFWWTYMAEYDGRPGSIIVNLALKDRAPDTNYLRLIVTGVSYASFNTNGLPDRSELDALNSLAEKRLQVITRHAPSIFAGAFTHDRERLDYIYVRDTNGISEVLKKFYAETCPDRKPYINVKEDVRWQAYFDFLFPNQQTIEFYRQELTKVGYLKN